MGTLANATCSCGYSQPLTLGGGMASFETECLFPIYCCSCRTLECHNLFETPLACPKCAGTNLLPYDAPELAGEPGGREVFSWHVEERLGRILRLSDGRYLCPACQQTQLQFEDMGSWD